MGAHAIGKLMAGSPLSRRGLPAALVLFALVAAGWVPLGGAAVPDDPVRFVVGFHALPDIAPGDFILGAQVLDVNPSVRFALVETAQSKFVERARDDPRVRYVERDMGIERAILSLPRPIATMEAPLTASVPSDDFYGYMHQTTNIRAEQGWLTATGSHTGADAAAVCIVDTGVRYTHMEIADRWLGGANTWSTSTNDPMDDHGHGTHVAGIAAGAKDNGGTVGIAPGVGIYGVKALNSGGGTSSLTTIANAVTWCADNTMPRTVINMSLGFPATQSVTDAIAYAYHTKGKPVVVAAGNSGPCTHCVGYPASLPDAIAVSATNPAEGFAYWSSQGSQVDLSAPGENILNAYISGSSNTIFAFLTGTSMAAPAAAGAAALLWSAEPGLTNIALRQRLRDTAQDLGAPGHDPLYGHGELDVKCLLEHIAPCTVPAHGSGKLGDCETRGPIAGYTCRLIPYAFTDVRTTGTPVTWSTGTTGVAGRATFTLPFPFTFYGTTYNELTACRHGYLATSPSQSCYAHARWSPTSTLPNGVISGYWSSYASTVTAHTATLGTAPTRTWVIQWTDAVHESGTNTYPSTFQIRLNEGTNDIEVHILEGQAPPYGHQQNAWNHQAGIENPTGSAALHYRHENWDASALGVRFSPNPVPGLPGAPLELVATPGNNKILLDWTPPAENGGLPLSYRVHRAEAAAGPYALIATVAEPGHVDDGLGGGFTGHYRVSAVNEVGESAASGVATATSFLEGVIAAIAAPAAGSTFTRLDPIAFQDGSSDEECTIVARTWDFGDGTTSHDQDPSHQYAATTPPGTLSVTLSVDGACGETDTTSIPIHIVNIAPEADLTASTVSTTAGESVEFDASGATDEDGSIVSYLFNVDGDTLAAQASPVLSRVFDTTGTHTVAVRVIDNEGAESTEAAVAVEVAPGPVATLSIAPTQVDVAAGRSAQFTAEAEDGYGNPVDTEPSWSSDCGSIDATGLFTAPTTAGLTCSVTAILDQTATATVTVVPDTLATLTMEGPTSMVAGTTQNFPVSGVDTHGNAVPLAVEAVQHTAGTAAGTIETVSYTEQGVTVSRSVDIVPDALAHIAITPAGATLALGDAVQLAAQGADQYGNAVDAEFLWAADIGTVNATGLYNATSAGTATVTARADGVSRDATIKVFDGMVVTVRPDFEAYPAHEALLQGVEGDVRARFPDGTPIADASVTLVISHAQDPLGAVVRVETTGTTDASGTMRWEAPPGMRLVGAYDVTATVSLHAVTGTGAARYEVQL